MSATGNSCHSCIGAEFMSPARHTMKAVLLLLATFLALDHASLCLGEINQHTAAQAEAQAAGDTAAAAPRSTIRLRLVGHTVPGSVSGTEQVN